MLAALLSPSLANAAQTDASEPTKLVAESTYGSYVVVLDADPLVATVGRDGLESPGAKRNERAMKNRHADVLDDAGVDADNLIQNFTIALNGFAAVMSHDEAERVAAMPGIRTVIPDELRQLTTDSSTTFLGLDGPASAWSTGATGEGVVVGVIDSGIWPEHPSFADDGSYDNPGLVLDESVYSACDFGNSGHNANDADFECNNKLIGARQTLGTYRFFIGAESFEYDSARDDNGHGTHTASTAAGNAGVEAEMFGRSFGTVSGVAPRAHIIAYKGLGDLGGFTSDLVAAINQAVADGVDVINYSVGGGPSLAGADDIAYLFAAAAGVFVATSAGNSGNGPGTIGGPASVPWLTSVGASTQPRFFQGTVTLGDGSTFTGASVTGGTSSVGLVDAEFAGGDLCIPGSLDSTEVAGKIVLCRRGAIARAAKSEAVAIAGGVGMILYNNDDVGDLSTDPHVIPSVHTDLTPGLAIKAYIASEGADATAAITAPVEGVFDAAPSSTKFSSRGPNMVAPDIIKPDVTAPGHQILAGNTPTPPPGSAQGELFMSISGTSMSSPHVAGIFALIKQEHPDWTPAMAKSAIMTTASQAVLDSDRVSPADPFTMGSGLVDPGNAVAKGSAFQPGLVYDAGLFEYAAFTCGANLGVFTPGSCGFLEAIGVPSDASDLNLASIGVAELAGSQTVTRTVTSVAEEQGWRTYSVSVDAPDGYDVIVEPASFAIKSGQSVSYSVTIINDGTGSSDQWSHGSLTWEDSAGHYSVFSPISVLGAVIGVPAGIEGSGDSGSASFDVLFGYSGDYTAAAHGLVAPDSLNGNVVQDPDQSFSPFDGFSDLHVIGLSGSAVMRLDLEIAGPDDIDLFLFDPIGNLVASSTNGGTDEEIVIQDPMDGDWSLYVHGWSVPNQPLAYDISLWDVSATPGGSLSLDSAPAAAIVGTTGSIDISWAGLTPGTDYLGLVSHGDASGVLAYTMVEIAG